MYRNNTSSAAMTGIGIPSALTLFFIALKLIGFIDWSWFWVLFPSICGVALTLLTYCIVRIVVALDDKKYK